MNPPAAVNAKGDSEPASSPAQETRNAGAQGARTAVSDEEGRFNVPFLTPGDYTVRAELQGFKAVEQPNVNVSLGQRVALDLLVIRIEPRFYQAYSTAG